MPWPPPSLAIFQTYDQLPLISRGIIVGTTELSKNNLIAHKPIGPIPPRSYGPMVERKDRAVSSLGWMEENPE